MKVLKQFAAILVILMVADVWAHMKYDDAAMRLMESCRMLLILILSWVVVSTGESNASVA